MTVFDYAIETPTGLKRVSRARAKGMATRGELGDGDRIIVVRREPREARQLNADELRTHFDLIANGIDDPFSRGVGEVVSEDALAAAAPSDPSPAAETAPPPSATPPTPPPATSAATGAAAGPLSMGTDTSQASEPEADDAQSRDDAAADSVPAAPPAALETAPEPQTPPEAEARPEPEARPVEAAGQTGDAPRGEASGLRERLLSETAAPKAAPTAPPSPALTTERDPVAAKAAAATEIGLETRVTPSLDDEADSPGMFSRMRVIAAAAAAIAVFVLAAAVVFLTGVFSNDAERVRAIYAAGAATVYATPDDEAETSGVLHRGQPLTGVLSGGDAPPPTGWVRIAGPEALAGGFVRLDDVSLRPLPEDTQVRYAAVAEQLFATPDDPASVDSVAPGARLMLVMSGGESPPAEGWARVVEPQDQRGRLVRVEGLSSTPMPERATTVFAREDSVAYPGPAVAVEPAFAFAARDAVRVVTQGGEAPPPDGWGRVLEPVDAQGLFVSLAGFDAALGPEQTALVYAREGAAARMALDGAGGDDGVSLGRGVALTVVTAGGDNPPPDGWLRITEPASYAGWFITAEEAANGPIAEQRADGYAATALTAVAAPPADVWLPSGAQAPALDGAADIARGEAVSVVLSGGVNAPPPGWALITTPARLAGAWVRESDLTTAPLEAERAVLYAAQAVTLRDGPSVSGTPLDLVSAGARLVTITSGGEAAPPPGWGVIDSPASLAGAFVSLSGLSSQPSPETRLSLFTVAAVDVYNGPDLASDPLATLPRAAPVEVVVAGGANPPPTDWARVTAPDTLSGGFVDRRALSADDRPQLLQAVDALWTADTALTLRSRPDEGSEDEGRLSAGDSIYVVGQVSDDWLEVRRGRARIAYADIGGFEQSGAFLQSIAPEVVSLIGETWFAAVEPTSLFELPKDDADIVETLGFDEAITVVGRIDPVWVQVARATGEVAYARTGALSDRPAPVVTQPALIRGPTASAMNRVYPRQALNDETPGQVGLNCQISVQGRGDCVVIEETPAGLGFGDAALQLADDLRFSPRLEDDEPVPGGVVQFTLVFQVE